MRSVLISGILAVLAAWPPVSTRAEEQDSRPLIGQRVIPIRENVVIRKLPAPDAPKALYLPLAEKLDVKRQEGDWLQVHEYWIYRPDIVPIEQAIEYFTADIQRTPSAFAYGSRALGYLYAKEPDLALQDADTAVRLEPNNAFAIGCRIYCRGNGDRVPETQTLRARASAFSRVLELEPKSLFGYTGRAHIRVLLHDYDGAIDDFTAALRLRPNDAYVQWRRGHAYRAKCDYDRAIEEFTAAIQSVSTDSDAVRASIYEDRAGAYAMKGENASAISDFDKAIQLNANSAHAFYSRGLAYRDNQQASEAIQDFKQCLQLKPDFVQAQAELELLAQLQGKAADDNKPDGTKTAERGRPSVKLCQARGMSLYLKSNFEAALLEFDKAIEREPEEKAAPGFAPLYANLYSERGATLMALQDYARAVEDYNRAFQLSPPSAVDLSCRAFACRQLGRFDEARRDLAEAVRLNPRCAAAYGDMARLLQDQGHLGDAIEKLNEGLQHCGNEPSLFTARASLQLARRDYRAALQDISKAIELNPKEPNAYVQRAQVHDAMEDFNGAKTDFDRAVEISPRDSFLLLERAEFFLKHYMAAEALGDFSAAIRANPKCYDGYLERAALLAEDGKYRDAIDDLARAISIEPTETLPFLLRSAIWLELHEDSKAIEDADHAIKLDPASASAYRARAELFKELGRDIEAGEDFHRAEQLETTSSPRQLKR